MISLTKTLFVIGNGFDLYHGVQSRYEDFHKWLTENRNWSRFESIEQHFRQADLWSNLEESLGTFDSEECGKDWSIATPLGIFFNGQLICTARELNEDFDEPLREWREEMLRGLSEWVKTLRQSGEAPKLPTVSPDAQYLNFNYTRILEDLYGIDPCQIRHIHGVAGLSWDRLHLGHDFEVEDPLDDDMKDYNPEMFDEDRVTPVQQLNDHVRKWRKPVQELIQQNADFWECLREVSKVIILGFSFGRVDEPYIRKIVEVVRQDAVWCCSWYGKDEDVKIGKILTSVGVRNIELFRLDEKAKGGAKGQSLLMHFFDSKEKRMGLVKTRRLAAMHPPSPRLWLTSRRTRKQQRAIHLRQGYGGRVSGLKAAMRPPMKGGGRKACSRQFPFEERKQGK